MPLGDATSGNQPGGGRDQDNTGRLRVQRLSRPSPSAAQPPRPAASLAAVPFQALPLLLERPHLRRSSRQLRALVARQPLTPAAVNGSLTHQHPRVSFGIRGRPRSTSLAGHQTAGTPGSNGGSRLQLAGPCPTGECRHESLTPKRGRFGMHVGYGRVRRPPMPLQSKRNSARDHSGTTSGVVETGHAWNGAACPTLRNRCSCAEIALRLTSVDR